MKFDSFFSNGLKPPTRLCNGSGLKICPKNSGLGIIIEFCPDMLCHDHRIHGIGIVTLLIDHQKSTIHVRKCASPMNPMGYG